MLKLIYIFFLAFLTLIEGSRIDVENPQVLDNSTFIIKLDEDEILEIEVTAFNKSITLKMFVNEEFFSSDLTENEVAYYEGSAFQNFEVVGAAFGEYRKEYNHFLGEFRDNTDSYHIEEDEEDLVVYIYRSSDQHLKSTGLKDRLLIPKLAAEEFVPDQAALGGNPDIGYVCPIKVTVDHSLYTAMKKDESSIKSLVLRLIQATNVIFEENDIRAKSSHTHSVYLTLEDLLIIDDWNCLRYPSSMLCQTWSDSGDFLDAFAKSQEHEKYCLSYLFTNHHFEGTLGVAYLGGVCSLYSKYYKLGYNTGFVSLRNPHGALFQSEGVLAHEVGHNLGADHDGQRCGKGYLMHPYASSSDTKKSKTFSSCSKQQITRNFYDIKTGRKRNCFTKAKFV